MRELKYIVGVAALMVGCGDQTASVSSDGPGEAGSFITEWKVSEGETLQLPLVETGDYDFTVAWGDGSEHHITAYDDPASAHSYTRAGEYEVRIDGRIRGWDFGPLDEFCYCVGDDEESPDNCGPECVPDRPAIRQLRRISRWGSVEFGETTGHFSYCSELVIDAPDAPRLRGSLERFFDHCNVHVAGTGLSDWDTSAVTNMSQMFSHSTFDGDISGWDVSAVTDMSMMFYYSPFSGDIPDWDVSAVTDMQRMFSDSAFDGDLSSWEVSAVTDMQGMFENSPFAGELSRWDVSGVSSMYQMFANSQFNSDISDWNTSNVTNMGAMFSHSPFNSDISDWDTSNVTSMGAMFSHSPFNSDISNWDTSNVTSMISLFYATPFDGSISGWDVSAVTDMSGMFHQSTFDGDISNWDVSAVTDMGDMFNGSGFDRDISSWDIRSITNMAEMFRDGSLSTENYDKLLVSWSQQDVVDIYFSAGSARYSDGTPADAREMLVSKGWKISDGGPVE